MQKQDAFFFSAKNIVKDAPKALDALRLACAGVLWVSGKRSSGVARHFNLRNYIYKTCACITHDVLDFILGVKAAIACFVVGARLGGVMIFYSGVAPSAYFGQKWILFNFNAPTLVIGKVPMQGVEFVICHQVNKALDFIDREKMSRHIEVQAAPLKLRVVFDEAFGKTQLAILLRAQLQQ